MAKGDTPALRMRLEGGRLVPGSAYDQERLASYRNGSIIHVTIWQKRNEKLLRKYWAVLTRAVADCPTPWENAEEASDALKMALGITDLGHSVNGQRFIRPGSISFSTMDEAAFADFYEKAIAVLARVTGVDPETLSAESADVGHDGQDDAQEASAAGDTAAEPESGAALPPPEDAGAALHPSPSTDAAGELRREAVAKFMELATAEIPAGDRRQALATVKDAWKDRMPDNLGFVKQCFETADKVISGELPAARARQFLEGTV